MAEIVNLRLARKAKARCAAQHAAAATQAEAARAERGLDGLRRED